MMQSAAAMEGGRLKKLFLYFGGSAVLLKMNRHSGHIAFTYKQTASSAATTLFRLEFASALPGAPESQPIKVMVALPGEAAFGNCADQDYPGVMTAKDLKQGDFATAALHHLVEDRCGDDVAGYILGHWRS